VLVGVVDDVLVCGACLRHRLHENKPPKLERSDGICRVGNDHARTQLSRYLHVQ